MLIEMCILTVYMLRNPTLHPILVVFVVLSYSLTVPVLSVLHSHGTFGITSSSNEGEIHTSNLASKNHPVYCEICVRMQSTQSFAAQPLTHVIIQPQYEAIFGDGEVGSSFSLSFLHQDRAPP